MRFVYVLAAAVLTAISGCAMSASPPIEASSPRVSLMSEGEFDDFADRIATRIPEAFSAPGTGMPPALPLPAVSVERINEQKVCNDFARSLVAGVNDRLGGRTRFDQTVESARGPRSQLTFTDAEGGTNPDRRVVTFTITDSAGGRELLRESMEFEPGSPPRPAPPPRSAPPPPPDEARPADKSAPREAEPPRPPKRESPPPRKTVEAPPPAVPEDEAEARADDSTAPRADGSAAPAETARDRDLEIDLKGQELIDALARRAVRYDAWTRQAEGGELIFLDEDSFRRFSVQRIRSSRTDENKLRVDITLRTQKDRDGDYRFIFYDDAGNAVSSTPVLSTEFPEYRAATISITAANTRAAQWICLFEED